MQCGAFLDWSRAEQESVEGGRTEPVAATAGGGPAGSSVAAAVTVPSTVPPPRDPEPARQTAGARVAGGLQEPAVRPMDPPPRQTIIQPAAVEPSPSGCRRCGTANPPELRFCRKCGLEFSPPRQATAWDARPRPRVPWWRRIFGGHRTPSERAALRAYRRSLPMRYRLIRIGVALLVLLLLVGAVIAGNRDPIGWAKARWYDFKGTVVPVRDITPTLDPAVDANPDFPPSFAVDGNEASAWATTWTGAGEPEGCGAPNTAAGLLLTFEQPVDLRRLVVRAGLPTDDVNRLAQHRPRVLELRFSDGECVPLTLTDTGEQQVVELAPVSTTSVRIDVVDVYLSDADGATFVALSEVELLQRPQG
ncbi:hypothetical protein E4P39_05815 [Blastococcus sp. CT_GayMR19]|uniref:NADase-type glycan-binding domain-containing protein n=1 Tax=Blastococcus sp. CT_GayMR19 TaxID=2559608 RepID=UPI0010737477|nr:hypothetical protein [Blastococcus sp. CT_GayMR19]TFV77493.1 hypothetical protein E4P39_05815 [Blastococcus sp. CT_GayMR19]